MQSPSRKHALLVGFYLQVPLQFYRSVGEMTDRRLTKLLSNSKVSNHCLIQISVHKRAKYDKKPKSLTVVSKQEVEPNFDSHTDIICLQTLLGPMFGDDFSSNTGWKQLAFGYHQLI